MPKLILPFGLSYCIFFCNFAVACDGPGEMGVARHLLNLVRTR